MKTYVGTCGMDWVHIDNDGEKKPLPFRLDLRSHSPDGFSWGYGGSGPAQLALAILADCFNDDLALRYYFNFRNDVIQRIPMGTNFQLPEDKVREYIVNYILKEK